MYYGLQTIINTLSYELKSYVESQLGKEFDYNIQRQNMSEIISEYFEEFKLSMDCNSFGDILVLVNNDLMSIKINMKNKDFGYRGMDPI